MATNFIEKQTIMKLTVIIIYNNLLLLECLPFVKTSFSPKLYIIFLIKPMIPLRQKMQKIIAYIL